MIERFYLKNYLSFRKVELNPISGLIVFTGPSGSGKSILMKSILASLGREACSASICESAVNWELDSDSIESDDINIFKHIKKEKSRYFINSQALSKKAIAKLSINHLKHLSLKDFSDFENENLISIIDSMIQSSSYDILALKESYKESFLEHREIRRELNKIEEEERKIVELKEFASFEISKIDEINPKISEDEELLEIKRELSKKEKALEKIALANIVFEGEHVVNNALNLLDVNSSFFDDTMNELRAIFDSAEVRFNALEDIDIEEVLNRIEELGKLKRRYGSIEEALAYREQKILELVKYENIEITKDELVKKEAKLSAEVKRLADLLSELRRVELIGFGKDLNGYLEELYLRDAEVVMQDRELELYGKDEILIKLNGAELSKVSTGEFNRLRLAILALKSEYMSQDGAVLMLDEIDANLSGEESMSVAKVLRKLSKKFQIFVISHQPQLTSMGEQHFLIYKDNNESMVRELSFEDRVDEIARIISGDSVSNEARKFAKELLEANKCVL